MRQWNTGHQFHWVESLELISLKINSTANPRGRGAVEYIYWCIMTDSLKAAN